MQKTPLGYDEELLEVNGEYDYHGRSYRFSPIYEIQRGSIATAAMLMCRECRTVIRGMGGGSNRAVCLQCYPAVKLRDFSEGHTHDVKEY